MSQRGPEREANRSEQASSRLIGQCLLEEKVGPHERCLDVGSKGRRRPIREDAGLARGSFDTDRTTSGTTLKWLSIIDEYTRECVALVVDRTITSESVINTLAELFQTRGVPKCIRSDNGPEFISHAIRTWLERLGIEALYIAPGSPRENGYAESFHSKFRDEFLDRELLENLRAAQAQTAAWREDYNHHRPHSSLGYQAPSEFAARCRASATKRAEPSAPPASPLQPHNGPLGSAQPLPPELS